MRNKRTLLYTALALFLLSMCFLLVHTAAIPNPLPPGAQVLKGVHDKINKVFTKSATATPKIVELQLGEKVVRYKKKVEDLDYVDTIRKPRKLPIVKADNKINAVVDANNVSAY